MSALAGRLTKVILRFILILKISTKARYFTPKLRLQAPSKSQHSLHEKEEDLFFSVLVLLSRVPTICVLKLLFMDAHLPKLRERHLRKKSGPLRTAFKKFLTY